MGNNNAQQRFPDLAGQKIMGCFPLYPPSELFHALGLTPVTLWNLQGKTPNLEKADSHIQSFTCSIARQLAQFVLQEESFLDGIFSYNACDTLRNMPEILEEGLKAENRQLPFFQMHLPMVSLQREEAREYFRKQVSQLIEQLEEFTGNSLDGKAFQQSAELYFRLRQTANRLGAKVSNGKVSYVTFTRTLLENNFRPPEKQLEELLKVEKGIGDKASESETFETSPPGIILSGIQAPPISVIEAIENAGLRVVSNDIATQCRTYSSQPEPSADPLTYLEEFYRYHFPCSTLQPTVEQRPSILRRKIKDTGAKGIIFSGEKFCEYEFLEYPYLQNHLQKEGVHTLTLEFSVDDYTKESGAHQTRIEAFAEILHKS